MDFAGTLPARFDPAADPLDATPDRVERIFAIEIGPDHAKVAMPESPLTTPDGRYIVVRGRLWRRANPTLASPERERLVKALMTARRTVAAARRTHDADAEAQAHAAVDRAKTALGERGPVWWTDGAPDFNRHMARTTPYAAWYAEIDAERRSDRSAPPHHDVRCARCREGL